MSAFSAVVFFVFLAVLLLGVGALLLLLFYDPAHCWGWRAARRRAIRKAARHGKRR